MDFFVTTNNCRYCLSHPLITASLSDYVLTSCLLSYCLYSRVRQLTLVFAEKQGNLGKSLFKHHKMNCHSNHYLWFWSRVILARDFHLPLIEPPPPPQKKMRLQYT